MEGTASTFPAENSAFGVSRECIWAAATEKPGKGNTSGVLKGSVCLDNVAGFFLTGNGKPLLHFQHDWIK